MAGTDPTVLLPTRWARTSDPTRGVVVAARAPTLPPSGVAPEIVLRRTPATPDTDLREDDPGPEADLEDEDTYDLGDHPVTYRRFAHRLGTAELVSDQWVWPGDGRVVTQTVTLTCTVAREDYADFCEVFEAAAESVDPGAGGRSRATGGQDVIPLGHPLAPSV